MKSKVGTTYANQIIQYRIFEKIDEIWQTVAVAANQAADRGVLYKYPDLGTIIKWYKPPPVPKVKNKSGSNRTLEDVEKDLRDTNDRLKQAQVKLASADQRARNAENDAERHRNLWRDERVLKEQALEVVQRLQARIAEFEEMHQTALKAEALANRDSRNTDVVQDQLPHVPPVTDTGGEHPPVSDPTLAVKRKRGRPPGSKNRPKTPPDDVDPDPSTPGPNPPPPPTEPPPDADPNRLENTADEAGAAAPNSHSAEPARAGQAVPDLAERQAEPISDVRSTAPFFSSKSVEWPTPVWLILALKRIFAFTIDVCATGPNVCSRFYTILDDGLTQNWSHEVVFMNPPYGRDLHHWIEKAYNSSLHDATVLCVLPSNTDVGWFHDYCWKAEKIIFLRGRLKFGETSNSAPNGTMIVLFTPTGASVTGPVFSAHIMDLQESGSRARHDADCQATVSAMPVRMPRARW